MEELVAPLEEVVAAAVVEVAAALAAAAAAAAAAADTLNTIIKLTCTLQASVGAVAMVAMVELAATVAMVELAELAATVAMAVVLLSFLHVARYVSGHRHVWMCHHVDKRGELMAVAAPAVLTAYRGQVANLVLQV